MVTSHTGIGRPSELPSVVPWSKKTHWTARIIHRSTMAPRPANVPTATAMARGPAVSERWSATRNRRGSGEPLTPRGSVWSPEAQPFAGLLGRISMRLTWASFG